MKAPYFTDGQRTVYHADSVDCLEIVEADALVTDPPYGIGEAAGKNRSRSTIRGGREIKAKDYGIHHWDDECADDLLTLWVNLMDRSIVFGGNFYNLPPASKWLVWDKDNSGDFADAELAWTNLPGAVRLKKYRWNGMIQEHGGRHKERRFHPTQKPVPVMAWCLSFLPDTDVVVDPFMGSGTTLVAASLMGMKAIGIEREEKYCEAAANRLRQGVLWS